MSFGVHMAASKESHRDSIISGTESGQEASSYIRMVGGFSIVFWRARVCVCVSTCTGYSEAWRSEDTPGTNFFPSALHIMIMKPRSSGLAQAFLL